MSVRRFFILCAILFVSIAFPFAAQFSVTEHQDLDAVYLIKEEGLQRSHVMDIVSDLTDIYGPRLTGSPEIDEAAKWAEQQMREWGLTNLHREPFPFGRGWQNRRFVALALTPRAYPLIAYPKAWTPGTNGPVSGEATIAVIQNDNDFDAFRGKLRGKFVLSLPMREVAAQFTAAGRRYTEAELLDLATQPAPVRGGRGGGNQPNAFARKRTQFWIDEGVAAVLDFSRGDGGTVFVQAPPGVSREPNGPAQPPQVTLAVEHYGRIYRTLQMKTPVTLQMDIDNKFFDQDLNAFNLIGEIRGTDKAADVVMLGAHFDSWHSGTGATDNAAGSAVVMEAMRILKATGLKLRRTVRVALWSGEEQGLIGSRAYVKSHFADRADMRPKPEHSRLSGYFNIDNGTGQIRGVYLQSNEAVAPIMQAWMEPFRNMGMTTLSIRNTGSTDHVPFDEVGLPGFQFIQDEIEYSARTHHSNMDVYERIQPRDMMQNAVIVASFVYQAANREQALPRKPMPQPVRPEPGRGASPEPGRGTPPPAEGRGGSDR